MNADIPTNDRFEDRLLTAILDDYQNLAAIPDSPPPRLARYRHSSPGVPTSRRAPVRRAVPALVATAAAAALTAGAVAAFDSSGASNPPATVHTAISVPRVHAHLHGTAATGGPTAGQSVLYRLASVSAEAPVPQGRYVVLPETDTETGYSGESLRTSVVDTVTGASTTYQQAAPAGGQAPSSAYTSEPPTLTEGPDSTSTEAWYSALPTDPTALRAQLLSLAQQQAAQAEQAMEQQAAKVGKALPPGGGQPVLSDDDSVYQEADTLLWSPLVQPTLRAALYKVLAGTTGFTIASNVTDPAGRPAIAMTRTYTGVSETDTTYEDPSTGVVLAQVWKGGNDDVITAVYQPITSGDTIPPNPYST